MSDETRDDEEQMNPEEPLDDSMDQEVAGGEADTYGSPEDDEAAEEQLRRWDTEFFKKSSLHRMYKSWFLDYASYTILDRAVPYLDDGLKPVQRRILQVMSKSDNGLYNKVAGIVGDTMKLHPHGDASIYGALVALGQKGLLIDTQGNWGNILTGDPAAAPRYIEARLSKFALDVAFNPKTTVWKMSYDGRDKEPVTLPVRFPLLLAQGVSGLPVGLRCDIMPHNFNELVDASIAYLKGENFELFPDFPTGGLVDVSKYNDGKRGGKIRVRARIEKRDARTIAITEIPFTKTVSEVIESILRVNDKKFKIKKIDDFTANKVEVIIHLPAGVSPDKTIDALYAFTDCEVSISLCACVIMDRKPQFMGVSDILRHSTDRTVALLKQDLQIQHDELMQQWHILSLEKIFIEERIYKDPEYEQAKSYDEACEHIDKRLEPYKQSFIRPVTHDDLMHLFEIKMGRILRFSSDAAEEKLVAMQDEMAKIKDDIAHIIDYAINHFKRIKRLYGKNYQRLTEIRSFDNIEASKVIDRNKKLFVNRADGFVGYGLKDGDYAGDCSELDDVIVFYQDGRYVVKKIGEKVDVGAGVLYVAVFKKNDTRTVYNAIYTDGETGVTFAKRFNVTGITRDKEYDLTTATKGSKLLYFSANPNGEAELVKVLLKPKQKLRNMIVEYDFASLVVKGRSSKGNVVTKNAVHKVVLKRRGGSTLGGRKIWFEPETLRLNPDGRGELLGEFGQEDLLLVVTKAGDLYTTPPGFELHFDDNILKMEKYDPSKLWTAVYLDGESKSFYMKRFRITPSPKPLNFIGENAEARLIALSDEDHARFQISYGGDDKWREPETVEADDFVAEKGIKAKGKRLTTLNVSKVVELEPLTPSVRGADAQDDSPEETADGAEPDEPSLF